MDDNDRLIDGDNEQGAEDDDADLNKELELRKMRYEQRKFLEQHEVIE